MRSGTMWLLLMVDMDAEKVDTEVLLMEIEKRQFIWEIRTEEYKDRNKHSPTDTELSTFSDDITIY